MYVCTIKKLGGLSAIYLLNTARYSIKCNYALCFRKKGVTRKTINSTANGSNNSVVDLNSKSKVYIKFIWEWICLEHLNVSKWKYIYTVYLCKLKTHTYICVCMWVYTSMYFNIHIFCFFRQYFQLLIKPLIVIEVCTTTFV